MRYVAMVLACGLSAVSGFSSRSQGRIRHSHLHTSRMGNVHLRLGLQKTSMLSTLHRLGGRHGLAH